MFSFTDTRPGRSTARGRPKQKTLFESIKNVVLGKAYDLSLAFLSKNEIRRINKIYRGKDKPTNVLSFRLDKTAGEIFICPGVVSQHDIVPLFIHGLVHLKGFDHGSKMERKERQIRTRFGVK